MENIATYKDGGQNHANTSGQRLSCHAPLHEKCPQNHGHKGDPEVTPGTCGIIGEILMWVRGPGVGNPSHPLRLGVMRVRLCAFSSFMASNIKCSRYLNWRCELRDMANWVGHCLGTTPRDNNDLGVAPMNAENWTSITFSILAWMGQVKEPSASMQRVIVNEVVGW
jgi:hypothetical protein